MTRGDLKRITDNIMTDISQYNIDFDMIYFFLMDVCKADKCKPKNLIINIKGDELHANNSIFFLTSVKLDMARHEKSISSEELDYTEGRCLALMEG